MKFIQRSNKNPEKIHKEGGQLPSKSQPKQQPVIVATNQNEIMENKLLQSSNNHVFCTVRTPWTWIMEEICKSVNEQPEKAHITLVETYQELPTGQLHSTATTTTTTTSSANLDTSHRGRKRRTLKALTANGMNTLRIEVVENHQHYQDDVNSNNIYTKNENKKWTIHAFHGTSEAFDGLEDKDEFVRTIKRCRCEHLELSPPAVLINWDVSHTECMNLVGDSMPILLDNRTKQSKSSNDGATLPVAVLKEPMGKSGAGIFFVHSAEEIHEIIESNRKRAVEEPGLLDALIEEKGRIPSWVLQAEVTPCLLIRNRRKFHIRTYVVCIENVLLEGAGEQEDDDDLVKLFIYNRHEIRIANASVPEQDTDVRDRKVHIMDARAERKLIREEPELLQRKLNKKVELFAAQIFAKHFRPDIERRVALSSSALEEKDDESHEIIPHKFVVAGLDIMVTEDERIYLLEVNVNPSAPNANNVSKDFQNYLLGFMKDLVELVTTKGASGHWPGSNSETKFLSVEEVLRRKI